MFDRNRIRPGHLTERDRKSSITDIYIKPGMPPSELPDGQQLPFEYQELMEKTADDIRNAREHGSSVILAYGAHVIKNGCGGILRRLVEDGYVTHLATNGAGSIHDWEFAYLGRTEEDVRRNVQTGDFGTWNETGKYMNLAIILGAAEGLGYGESISRLIHNDFLQIPATRDIRNRLEEIAKNPHALKEKDCGLLDLLRAIRMHPPPELSRQLVIEHPYKQYSVQEAAYAAEKPCTVHPGIGYDIIYTHPLCSEAAIGRTAGVDFLKYVDSVSRLNGGLYLSVGSAIMSPMVFEKSLSMARNVAAQEGREIADFRIVVNDIQLGEWGWGTGREPPKTSPAYYLRFCKTFDRMGAREMNYVCADNRGFLLSLHHALGGQK